MKVLVADQFEQSGLDGLRAAGCDVVYDAALQDDALAAALADTRAQVLVVRSTKVTAAMMDAGHLSLIVRAGAGYNTIDVAHASARGIYVSNCPGKNAIAVAELAFGLILALDRRIPDNVAALRAGTWNKKEFSKAAGLFGKTLGLLGFGSIGQELARRAQAFGLDRRDLVAPLRGRAARRSRGARPRRRKPHVACHGRALARRRWPSRPTSSACTWRSRPTRRGSSNADVLGRLKPGAMFINTARAEVVDYDALEAAVRDRGLRVGLDVFRNEPATRHWRRIATRWCRRPASTAPTTSAPRPSRRRRRSRPRPSASCARSRRPARCRTS